MCCVKVGVRMICRVCLKFIKKKYEKLLASHINHYCSNDGDNKYDYNYGSDALKYFLVKNFVVWNGYSAIVKDKVLSDYFKSTGIGVDAQSFNCPVCLYNFIENDYIDCFYITLVHNSEYLSTHILNILIWQGLKDL